MVFSQSFQTFRNLKMIFNLTQEIYLELNWDSVQNKRHMSKTLILNQHERNVLRIVRNFVSCMFNLSFGNDVLHCSFDVFWSKHGSTVWRNKKLVDQKKRPPRNQETRSMSTSSQHLQKLVVLFPNSVSLEGSNSLIAFR